MKSVPFDLKGYIRFLKANGEPVDMNTISEAFHTALQYGDSRSDREIRFDKKYDRLKYHLKRFKII